MLTNIYHLLQLCNIKTVLIDKGATKFFYSVLEKCKCEGLTVDLVSVKDSSDYTGMILDKTFKKSYDLIVVKGGNFETLMPLLHLGIFIYTTGAPPKKKYVPFDYLGDCFEGYLYRNDLHSIRFDKLTVHDEMYVRDNPSRFFKRYLALLKHLNLKTIVEIGSCRKKLTHDLRVTNPQCCNQGHSTYYWAQSSCNVFTVDMSPACRSVLGDVKANGNLLIVTGDPIEYLREYNETCIDLLYIHDEETSPIKHLQYYLHATKYLSTNCFIVLDDTDVSDNEKGRKLVPQAVKDGFNIVYHGRQMLLYKGTPDLLYSSSSAFKSRPTGSSSSGSSSSSSSVSSSM